MSLTLPELIPVRRLNEHVYCPRLAYLEWVDGLFAHNADTAEGSFVHRRVDQERGGAPAAEEGQDESWRSTSVTVSSTRLGLIAKVDLIETRKGQVVPVEYKKGKPLDGKRPLREPELTQLCAQALILRDCGYRVEHAEVYFAGTRTRHTIEIDEALVESTLRAVQEMRESASRSEAPPPLIDSPKCPRCSLVGICLPDEVNALREASDKTPRRLVAGDPPSSPLYAMKPGSRLSKRGGRIVLLEEGKETASRRLMDVSHVAVLGNVSVGSALVRVCLDTGIPILWFSAGGWLSGFASGMPSKNVIVRVRQHRAAAIGSPEVAGAMVAGKIRNSRTLLRRHGGKDLRDVLSQLARLARAAEGERSLDSLLGIEGTAARIYFNSFGKLLKKSVGSAFAFTERNRRPPRDPVNALLSFFYALLIKDVISATVAVGLDPYIGLYHRAGFGRPALALDLAEEFRPLVGDSTVMMAVNNGEVTEQDFISRAGAVALTERGRRKAIAAYERRMAVELSHPIFRYKASYRRCLEIQARLLAAVLVGDTPAYRSLTTR